MVLTANTYTSRSGEHTNLVILKIQIAKLRSSISTPSRTFTPNSRLITVHLAPIIFRSVCTGGAEPPVARARAPVYPILATPLCEVIRLLLNSVLHILHVGAIPTWRAYRLSDTKIFLARGGRLTKRVLRFSLQLVTALHPVSYQQNNDLLHRREHWPSFPSDNTVTYNLPGFYCLQGE